MSCMQYTRVVGSCDVLRRKVVEVVSNSTTVVGWLGYSLSKVCQICRLAWLFGVEDVLELWAGVVVGECCAGGCVVSVGAMTP
jgi:predicted CDP-diglyceride synthetase/phosphatidate cytidylyltransferase